MKETELREKVFHMKKAQRERAFMRRKEEEKYNERFQKGIKEFELPVFSDNLSIVEINQASIRNISGCEAN